MMTKTGRRTWILSGTILMIAMIILLAVWLASYAAIFQTVSAEEYMDAPDYDSPDMNYVIVKNAHVTDAKNSQAPDGDIDTAEEFCYVMFSGLKNGTFTLGRNFKIEAENWYDNYPNIGSGVTINGNYKVVWNSAIQEVGNSENKKSTAKAMVGGLLAYSAGTIQNLYFYYSGVYYTTVKEGSNDLVCGGMIGLNTGSIEHCRVETAGAIVTEALKAGSVSKVGGLIGENSGRIHDSALLSSSKIYAYTSMSPSKDYKESKIYAGGLIGLMSGNGIDSCKVWAKASVCTYDYTQKFDGYEFMGVSVGKAYNKAEYVHPAGGMIGCMSNGAYAKNSTFDVWGDAHSIAQDGSSDKGTISGGFVGLLDSSFAGNISNNYFKLGCMIGSNFISDFNFADLDKWLQILGLSSRSVYVYGGEWIGCSLAEQGFTLSTNVLYIEGYNELIEAGFDRDSDEYSVCTGLLCGSGLNRSDSCKNNWIVRKLAECDTGKMINNSVAGSGFNHINVFGDGSVVATPSKGGTTIQAEAKSGKSPFYGWSTEPNKAKSYDDFGHSRTKELSNFTDKVQVQYLFFIDRDIRSGGELTQFANDVNLIKSYVWAHLSETGNDDGKIHFSDMKITLNWLEVEITKDFIVESGTPVIEDFYGKLNGNGHTISFASKSVISHKFKKDSDDKDKTYYNEYLTGLFGNIKRSASVENLNILFGGTINEESGLEYDQAEGVTEQIGELKTTSKDSTNTVESRTKSYSDFSLDTSSLDVDTAYLYLLTGENYAADREYNPGYIEIRPYSYNVVIDTHYIGILAGKNEGVVSNVNVEMTTTGSITSKANKVVFGGLIGYQLGYNRYSDAAGSNEANLSYSETKLKGRVTITAATSATVGGIIGLNECKTADIEYHGLNSFITGEIVVNHAEKYHRIVKYYYAYGKSFSKKDDCTDAGYQVIAYDNSSEDKYVFGVKDRQDTQSDTIRGNDPSTSEQTVGMLIGAYIGSRATIKACVASSGDEGLFNTDVIQCSESGAKVAAFVGTLSDTSSIPSFPNCWAVMGVKSVSQERKLIGNYDTDPGINVVYVEGGIAVGAIDAENEQKPVRFEVEAMEGMTFAGWYTGVSVDHSEHKLILTDKTMILKGFETVEVEGSERGKEYFRPDNQGVSSVMYYVRLIPMQLSTQEHLLALAETTSEGRSYEGIVFTLAENIDVPSTFLPIGTVENPFCGTFNGNGLKLTFSTLDDKRLIGLFGCIGKEGYSVGTVKNFVIDVNGNLGDNATSIAGVVAAVNYGTVGQDSSSGKVIVNINRTVQGEVVGGLVGINYGVVKNCEVTYTASKKSVGTIYVSTDSSDKTVYGGGAVGKNLTGSALVKNVIVIFEDDDDASQVLIAASEYVIGGLVGENDSGSTVATSVVRMNHGSILAGSMGSGYITIDPASEDHAYYRGYLIGNNLAESTDNVSSLWMLYTNFALGEPIKVYNGAENYPRLVDKIVLINGYNSDKGNALIMYSKGDISIAINAVDDTVSFYSEKVEDGYNFYGYLADFNNGTFVSEEEGRAGSVFAPASLSGKVYYAVFANDAISSQADYEALAKRINEDDFKAYVNYYVSKSFEIANAGSVTLGADEDHPFCGNLNGNGYTITISGNKAEDYEIHALIGVVGEYSSVSYLTIVAQRGTKITESESDAARGIMSNINYGTVTGIHVIVRGLVYNENGDIGAIAGKNYGSIESAVVELSYIDYLNSASFGAFVGENVGGAVGRNYGTIGQNSVNTVEVYIDKGTINGLLYGTSTTGGIVGVNEEKGEILSATAMIAGTLFGEDVGGIAGINNGSIYESFVTFSDGAEYSAEENFGGIAGTNNGTIGREYNAFSSDNKVYIGVSPTYEARNYSYVQPKAESAFLTVEMRKVLTKKLGGIVGLNKGELRSVSAEIAAPLFARDDVGGIAGKNEGVITFVDLTTSKEATLVAEKVGGIAGENMGTNVSFVSAIVRGNLGNEKADSEKGLVLTAFAGGFFGESSGNTVNVVVTLYASLYGNTKALALANGTMSAHNSWVQATNASPLPLSVGSERGFNSIRVLNESLLEVEISSDGHITFTSLVTSTALSTVAEWYTDISAWTDKDSVRTGFLDTNLIDDKKTYVTPKTAPVNATYYVCYERLRLSSTENLINLSLAINNHDYYRNVRFELGSSITFQEGMALTPIGTENHPFNAIFDGYEHSITFMSGSIISGTEYSGLFGYTSENSVICNMILNIREGTKFGGVNSKTIGALIGEGHGAVNDVYVNLATKIIAHSTATIGNFAGRFDGETSGCWVASANNTYKPIGVENEDRTNRYYGVNALDVLGNGALKLEYKRDSESESYVLYSVPDTVAFRLFDDWYAESVDVQNIQTPGDDTKYGKLTRQLQYNEAGEAQSGNLSLVPSKTCKNSELVISFIKTVIRTDNEFIDFAENINNYGDRGATFTLYKDIQVDFDECASVGTKEKPFTGTFEGNGYTITVGGNLIKREYAGVFGYVGENAKIKNTHFKVGENVTIGDRSTIYAGVAAAFLRGTLENVAVSVRADTVLHTTQGEVTGGGIVGRAEEGYKLKNAWLVIAEGSTVTNAVGQSAYYLAHKASDGEGRIMQQVGVGILSLVINKDVSIQFVESEGSFYGFIDNMNTSDLVVNKINDKGLPDRWTVSLQDSDLVSVHMLAVFIQNIIKNYSDLVRLSSDVRMGRNFRGITYVVSSDKPITLEKDFIPIGGEFASDDSTDATYVCNFIGGFDGGGCTIIIPESLQMGKDGLRYAGLFGRVGREARISNLCIEVSGKIGYDTEDNTTRTLYAGALAGYYDKDSSDSDVAQGKFSDIFVVLERSAKLYGATSVGRMFGYIPREVGQITTNCWAVSYNSKFNSDMNKEEIAYRADATKGVNQGGVHNIMVIAKGSVVVNKDVNGKFYFVTDEGSTWYTLNSILEKDIVFGAGSEVVTSKSYMPPEGAAETAVGCGYNVSYQQQMISTIEQLESYAESINDGYDFYELEFKLGDNIKIESKTNSVDFTPIGTDRNGLNGTFDGCGYTITLSSNAVINGEGIFGYIAENGILKNVRIILQGSIISSKENGYAGAVGYNYGKLENVLVVLDGATLNAPKGYGFVIGYDATDLLTNVWGLVDASEYMQEIGYTAAKNPAVNTMKSIGIGKIVANFNDRTKSDYRVKFYEYYENEASRIGISGWYKSYEDRAQISSDMMTGGELDVNLLVAPLNFTSTHYEVAVIQRRISSPEHLVAIAKDVNVGGYSFKNVEFILEGNIDIVTSYEPIGDDTHAFKGTFDGRGHTITITGENTIEGLFGNNSGEIKDLNVIIAGTVGETLSIRNQNLIYGGIANLNSGSITHSKVEIAANGKMVGYTLGGIAGRNDGTIQDCISIVKGEIKAAGSERNLYAGGIVGLNRGRILGTSDFSDWKTGEKASVYIYGTISAISEKDGMVNAGGAAGYNEIGSIEKTIISVEETGVIRAAWCDEKYENKIDEAKLAVDYCDCNAFGVILRKQGDTSSLIGRSNAQMTSDTLASFDDLAELFSSFMAEYVTTDTPTAWNAAVGSRDYEAFADYFYRAMKMYDNSYSAFTKNLNYDIGSGVVMGIGKPYTISFGSQEAPAYDTLKTVVARLFGYANADTFITYAKKLAEELTKNNAEASIASASVRLKYNGAVYTSNGYFVLPFAFRNEKSGMVLTFVMVDQKGEMSIWINDAAAALRAANYDNVLENTKTVHVHIYGRCALFEYAGSKARAGGLVGYSSTSINNNVVVFRGQVIGGAIGGTAGYLSGVTVHNTWQVTYTDVINAAGEGVRQINRLVVKGKGDIEVSIAFDSGKILFTDVTPEDGADRDGWYESGNVVSSSIGNLDEGTFSPDQSVTNKLVEVVFVNTTITKVQDLIDMASSVSGGLSGSKIEFTLENDIVVGKDDPIVAIGTASRQFANVFNGNGKTITFNNLGGKEYVALFGYVAKTAIIKDVTLVLNSGTYGTKDALYTALLAAYSEGRIENVTIKVNENATLVGQCVAALAGASTGEIVDVSLEMDGTIHALSEKDAYAAAFVANNSGIITNADEEEKHTIVSSGTVSATGKDYSYVGVIAAKSSSTISKLIVNTSSALSVASSTGKVGTAFAGFGLGMNNGKLENTYIDVTDGEFSGSGTYGGIVGNNAGELNGVLIMLPEKTLGAKKYDAAVGSIGGAGEAIHNVWVYAPSVDKMSKVAAVNCIMADSDMTMTLPTDKEVTAGTIVFKGRINGYTDRFAAFFTVENGVCEAGTGAVTNNLSYEEAAGSEIYLVFTSDSNVSGIKAVFTTRNAVGSGSELAAFGNAVNSGKYVFNAFNLSFTNDIVLPKGAFQAIGTTEHPLVNVNIEGNSHVISVEDSSTTIPDGVFGVSAVTIKNVGLRLAQNGTGTLVAKNSGTIENIALYLEKGAAASSVLVGANTGIGTVKNAWVITRNELTGTAYPEMKVNGNGDVKMVDGAFVAEINGEDMIFAGYTDTHTIICETTEFDTAGKSGSFTAEFISNVLDKESLLVLDGVVKLGYDKDQTFTLGTNVELDAELEGLNGASFKGTLDGAGFTLKVGDTFSGTLFGKWTGIVRNIRIDLSVLSDTSTLFAEGATPTLLNVVIVEDRDDLHLGSNKVNASYTYFDTKSHVLYERFTAEPYNAYSIIYSNGTKRTSYTFEQVGEGDKTLVYAKEENDDTQVFAGWKKDGIIDTAEKILLSETAGSMYKLSFIYSTLTSADDLVLLAEAVQGGFTYEKVVFTVKGTLTVENGIDTIGSADHPFKGDIRGTAKGDEKSTILFERDTETFLYELYGRMEDIVFVFKGKVVSEDNKPSLVYHNKGLMSAVVVVAGSAFTDGAALVYQNNGTMNNCWFLSSGTDAAVKDGSLLGVNRIAIEADNLFLTDVQIARSNDIKTIRFKFSVTAKSYLAMYEYSVEDPENAKVIFRDEYSAKDHSYLAVADTSGVSFDVRSKNTVSCEDELYYLKQYIDNHHLQSSTITLENDLTINSSISMDLGYRFDDTDYTYTIDLNGKVITLPSAGIGTLFTSKDGVKGTLQNGIVRIVNKDYAFASSGTFLKNVALHLTVKGVVIPECEVTNSAIVIPYKDDRSETYGNYTCYYYQSGADVDIVANETGVSVNGVDNDAYYFAAKLTADDLNDADEKTLYGMLSEKSYQDNEYELIYAPAVISSETDYKKFALANDSIVTHFDGKTFSFGSDFTLSSGFRKVKNFKGVLDAGHTLTISGGEYTSAVFAAAEGGSFDHLAIAFTSACNVEDDVDMIQGGTENCAVIVYQSVTDKLHSENTAVTLNVYETGAISASFDNGLTFTASDVGYYSLYSWETTGEGAESINRENGFAKKDLVTSGFSNCRTFKATFSIRYSYNIVFYDKKTDDLLDARLFSENYANLPKFKLTKETNTIAAFEENKAICFKADFETDKMQVRVDNIGTGFMFWGLQVGGVISAKSAEDAWVYMLSAPSSMDYTATIRVYVTYIRMEWKTKEYSASTQSVPYGEDSAIAWIIEHREVGMTFDYEYENLGSTPPLVEQDAKMLPYHVGTYRVYFTMTVGSRSICNAYAGLEITPVTLTFESLVIKDKVYDGTDSAELESFTMNSSDFRSEEDKTAIDFAGLTFKFVDVNAGDAKQVKVSGTGILCCSADKANDSTYKYTYLDYTFDFDSVIKSVREGYVTARIIKRDLRLEIESITVDYLSQFGTNGNVFLPKNDAIAAGLIEGDLDLYMEVVSGLITREAADTYDVGEYRIIVNEKGAFERLSNYNVSVSGRYDAVTNTYLESYYCIEPSEIEVIFNGVKVQYGVKPTLDGYVVKYNGEEIDISSLSVLDANGNVRVINAELVFENVVFGEGKELIPSKLSEDSPETKYDLKCLFSKENKNFTLKSEGENKDQFETVDGRELRVMKQAGVLTVEKRVIRVATDEKRNTKLFGKRKESLYAVLSGTRLASTTHTLVVTREAGETVGKYKLIYNVKDITDPENPVIVTDYYIIEKEGAEHFFTINKTSITFRLAQTELLYGEPIGKNLKYTLVIGDGSITVKDLYYALKNEEKADATLADIGILVVTDEDIVLNAGTHNADTSIFKVINNQTDNIAEIENIYGRSNCIKVQKRYVSIALTSSTNKAEQYNTLSKEYDGTDALPSTVGYTIGIEEVEKKVVVSVTDGLVEKDKGLVTVVLDRVYVVGGGGKNVGMYKVNADVHLVAKNNSEESKAAVDNYECRVIQISYEVKPASVDLIAQLGYYSEDGSFVAAQLSHKLSNGGENVQDDEIFYGDTRAILYYTFDEESFDGYDSLYYQEYEELTTDKEKSEYLQKHFNISQKSLYKLPYGNYDQDSNELALKATNNNYIVGFSEAIVRIAQVKIVVKLLPTTKTIGDLDPTVNYEIIAKDAKNDEIIEGYMDYAKDVYSVKIVADRTEGESLGKYEYSNIRIEVSNAYSGDVFEKDEYETDEEEAILIIKQESFIKTIGGKILAYGAPLLALLGGAIFLVIYVTVLRKKWKNRPKKEKKRKVKVDVFADDDEDLEDEESEKAPEDAEEGEKGDADASSENAGEENADPEKEEESVSESDVESLDI